MNCEQFREMIHDLAREDTSADALVTEAFAHAEECRECDALLREAERLTARLHTLASQHRFDGPPPQVEAALLQAFRKQRKPAARLQRFSGWVAAATAALASAAVVVILFTGYRPAKSPSPNPESAPRQSTRPLASPRATWADYAVEGESEEQAAEAYIPLAADFDPSWLEGGAIVRVALSRSALESMGVPATGVGDGQMIADMVVSDDGTPEAIRVLDWEQADAK
jgi:hypothetical protein